MDELRNEAVKKVGLVKAKSIEFVSGGKNKYISDNLPEHEITRIWGGDRRLSLFSYTIETITMLLLPMIRTRFVYIEIFFKPYHLLQVSINYYNCNF